MSRRSSVVITEDHRRGIALVRGWKARELVIDAGCKPYYTAVGKGWVVDLERLPDLAAVCDYANVGYRFVERGTDA